MRFTRQLLSCSEKGEGDDQKMGLGSGICELQHFEQPLRQRCGSCERAQFALAIVLRRVRRIWTWSSLGRSQYQSRESQWWLAGGVEVSRLDAHVDLLQ